MPPVTFKNNAEQQDFMNNLKKQVFGNLSIGEALGDPKILSSTVKDINKYLNNMSSKEPRGNEPPKAQSLLYYVNAFINLVFGLEQGDINSVQNNMDMLRGNENGGFEDAMKDFLGVHGYKTLDDKYAKLIHGMVDAVGNVDMLLDTQSRQNSMQTLESKVAEHKAYSAHLQEYGKNYAIDCLANGIDPKDPKAHANEMRKQIKDLKAQNEDLLDQNKHLNIATQAGKKKVELIGQKNKAYETLSGHQTNILILDEIASYAQQAGINIQTAQKKHCREQQRDILFNRGK